MFNNIGRKIKLLAEINCWLGIFICILGGIGYILEAVEEGTVDNAVIGFILMLCGPVFVWLYSSLLYGFGKLVENSDTLVNLRRYEPRRDTDSKDFVRIQLSDPNETQKEYGNYNIYAKDIRLDNENKG